MALARAPSGYIDITSAPSSDAFEDDDTPHQASWLFHGSPQVHSILPRDDEDRAKFVLVEEAQVALETSGPSGDTGLDLYDVELALVQTDDDSGSGAFSRIDRVCDADALPAGIYLARVGAGGQNIEVPIYLLSLQVQNCSTRFKAYLPVASR